MAMRACLQAPEPREPGFRSSELGYVTLGDRTELVWGSALFLSPSAAGGPTHMVDGKSRGN